MNKFEKARFYSVRFSKISVKNLNKIFVKDRDSIISEIEELANAPYVKSNVKKLISSSHYRLRIGDYRVLFDIHNEAKYIDIIDILHRKDAYRG